MNPFLLLVIFTTVSISMRAQQFTVIDTLPTGAYGTAAWGDFNNDGWKDLAYLSQVLPQAACLIYENQNNVFTPVSQHFPYLFNPSVIWADLDNDGFDDLVMCGLDSVLTPRTIIYRSLGDGGFEPQTHPVPGLSSGSIDIADYNHDGWKDIAICGYGESLGPEAYIFRNTGSFEFTDIGASLKGVTGGEVKWQDYDGDGLPDLSTNGFGQNTARVRFYRNLGMDVFLEEAFSFEGSGGTLDWFDYNLDGIPDFFITGVDSTSTQNITALYHNDGNRNFTRVPVNIPDFGEPSAVAIADFNHDGMMDICLAGGNNTFFGFSAMAYGQGTFTFDVRPFHPAVIDNLFVDAADMDSDGHTDLVLSTFLLRNSGVPTDLVRAEDRRTDVMIYPNPGSANTILRTDRVPETCRIFDLSGRLLSTQPLEAEPYRMTLQGLRAGTYLFVIAHRDGSVSSVMYVMLPE